MTLVDLGWDERFAAEFELYAAAGLSPARVVKQHRERCLAAGEAAEWWCGVSGRFRHEAADRSAYPVIGDWVAVQPGGAFRAVIHAVLPRRSAFARKVAGADTAAQVAAANVDTVFLVSGLDGDFNLRRIERYVTTAFESGAFPVVVLNKADLCAADLEPLVEEARLIAPGIPVLTVSAKTGGGLDALRPFLEPGRTIALLGSSGAGKSTLINRLLGEERLRTAAVRADDSRGRHTTTHRELVALRDGALLIDTPGMRELQLWAGDEALAAAFDDVTRLAAGCRFADCSHETEPGCAVRAAVEARILDEARLRGYLKQRSELRSLEIRRDEKTRRQAEKRTGRKMAAMIKEVKRSKPRYR